MASNSGWTKGLPSGQSTVNQTDDEFRSFKSYMEAWWETEHYATSGSETSAGIAKHGAGRAYVGTASQLSNPTADNDGRLFFVTDTNVLRIGRASTSSWSVVADNVTLASDNSWTGTNEFAETVFNPTDSDWKIFGFVSGHTVLASTFGIAAGGNTGIVDVNVGSGLTTGDPITFGSNVSEAVAAPNGIADLLITGGVRRSDASIVIRLENLGSSRFTFNSGSTLRWIGFKSS